MSREYGVDFGTLMVDADSADEAAEKAIKMLKEDISWLEIDIVQPTGNDE